MAINRHMISHDMLLSKRVDQAYKERMNGIEKTIKNLEKKHLLKFDDASDTSKNISSQLQNTNNTISELNEEVKRLTQANTDKISHLKVHASHMDKFEDATKLKIEDILSKIRDNRTEAKERDEGVERKINSKFDRFKTQTEEKFSILQKGKQ